jgi:hypothetical protein
MPARPTIKFKKKRPPKDKGGRPSFKPTDQQRRDVLQYAAVGIGQDEMCVALGISLPTLHKYFRTELDTGAIKANAVIGGSIFNAGRNGNMQAAIFWAKTRMGWKETNVQEVTGKDGGPIQTEDVTADPASIIAERLAQLAAAHAPKDQEGGS